MKSRRILYWATSVALAPFAHAWGQVYYVSPTGSDSNSGTSPSSPWQTLSKVSTTDFAPGSQILFQAGGNWYGQQLAVDSSGTPSDPITYGSYGSGANPTFWGSVIVPSTSFTPVVSEPNTYFYPTTTPVNAFLINHQFTNNASLVSSQTTDAGNISYVESTANSNYYDPDKSTESNGTTLGPGLYVNMGGSTSTTNVYTAAIQDNVVSDFGYNNLIFKNINVQESANYNDGYGYQIQSTSNVQILNSTVIAAGKHAFSAINSTGFVGENLTASYMMPDQGYGGASAFVSFSDSTVSNTTSQWIDDTFNNANGEYPAFITHGAPSSTDPTPIASILVQNMVTDSYPAMAIYTSGNEKVNIVGGQATGGDVELEGNNTTLNGMLLTGPYSTVGVGPGGTGNIIENTIINGATPNWEAAHDGAIVDSGSGTIIRYNTIVLGQAAGTLGAAIALENNTTNTQLYGNIIDTPYAAIYQVDPGTPNINAFDNLFTGTSNPKIIFLNFASADTPIADWPTTISANELYGNANFVDLAGGNVAIEPNSVAAYVFNPTTDQYVMYDYYNNLRPSVLESLGAIQVTAPTLSWTNASGNGMWDAGTSSNWNNGSGATIYMDQSIVLFDDANNGNYAITLNTTVSPGLMVVSNSNGNYTISGSGRIAGTASLTKSGSGTLTLSTVNSYTGGTTVNAGTLIAAVSGAIPSGSLNINSATVALAGGTGTAQLTSLSITANGTLDINNNQLIINYSGEPDPITSIVAWIVSGYANGAWNGPGIISSSAQNNSGSYGIGYTDAADPGNPAGLSAGTIEIMYTLLGDANLDGQVNGSDFALMATNFNKRIADGWDQGDFNYDGVVNGSDFVLLADNFNQFAIESAISAADLAALDSFAAANGISLANVPEPASAMTLAIAGVGILRRRRRSGE